MPLMIDYKLAVVFQLDNVGSPLLDRHTPAALSTHVLIFLHNSLIGRDRLTKICVTTLVTMMMKISMLTRLLVMTVK